MRDAIFALILNDNGQDSRLTITQVNWDSSKEEALWSIVSKLPKTEVDCKFEHCRWLRAGLATENRDRADCLQGNDMQVQQHLSRSPPPPPPLVPHTDTQQRRQVRGHRRLSPPTSQLAHRAPCLSGTSPDTQDYRRRQSLARALAPTTASEASSRPIFRDTPA